MFGDFLEVCHNYSHGGHWVGLISADARLPAPWYRDLHEDSLRKTRGC